MMEMMKKKPRRVHFLLMLVVVWMVFQSVLLSHSAQLQSRSLLSVPVVVIVSDSVPQLRI
jgi:hypothetical protein